MLILHISSSIEEKKKLRLISAPIRIAVASRISLQSYGYSNNHIRQSVLHILYDHVEKIAA